MGLKLAKSKPSSMLRVVWVTNLMAPYRLTLWENVAERSLLSVVLVEGGNDWVLSQDRNSDWATRPGQNYSATNLRAFTLRTPMGRFHLSGNVFRMIRDVRAADVVLAGAWESPVYWQYMLIAKAFRRPVVLFHESTNETARFRKGLVWQVKKYIFNAMNAVVVPGISSGASVLDLGVNPDRVFEGFNAVDVNHFARPAEASMMGNGSGQSSGHRFLYVGKLIERKQVGLLISAFAEVRRTGDRLSIAGKGHLEESLRRLVRDLQLDSCVDFLGEVSYGDLPRILWQHQTLVLPSKPPEQWGLVVNEALAAGLHVVVSKACGVAASVRGMEGVHVWDGSEASLGRVLLSSVDSWSGWISGPEILRYSNASFAQAFLDSFSYVVRKSKSA